MNPTPTTQWYEADGLGSVTSLTNANGALAGSYTYDSFGKLTATSGSINTRFRYTGREWDGNSTGLYYYRARYYDPNVGRFISEDPIRNLGELNRYVYTRNNPVVLRDPSGGRAFGLGAGFAGGIGIPEFAAFGEVTCSVVVDSNLNVGVLCCAGAGAGGLIGGGISLQGGGLVCTNCDSICQLEGFYVKPFGIASEEAGAAGGIGVSVGSSSFVVEVSAGPAAGFALGGGVIVGKCKLVAGEAACKKCTKETKAVQQ